MTTHQHDDNEDQALVAFLHAQRDVVLSIVAGLVEHLGGAEWHWFQGVVAGKVPEPAPGDDDTPYDPTAAFVSDEPSAEIIGFYREQCARSDAVLAETPLSAAPRGKHGDPEMEPENVRWVVLHMIEET